MRRNTSFAINFYFITRIDETCNRQCSWAVWGTKTRWSRRWGAIGRIAPRAQLNSQILWSSVFPTISIFLSFLLLFHYRLFQHSLKNRYCSLSPQFTSRRWSGLMIARAYVCDVLYKTRWYRACLLFLCRAHEVCEFTAWSVARENKSTNCRLTDSGQTRERRGTSL